MLSNSEEWWSDIELPLPRGLNLKCIGPIEEDLCCNGQTVHVGTLKQRQPLRTNTYINLPQSRGVWQAVSPGSGWLLVVVVVLSFLIQLVFPYLKSKSSQYGFGEGGAISKRLKQMTEKALDKVKMIVQSIGINIAIGELSARPHGLHIVTFGDSTLSLKAGVSRRNFIPYI